MRATEFWTRDAVENRIAAVEAELNKANCDSSGSVVSKGVTDVTKSMDVIESRLAN